MISKIFFKITYLVAIFNILSLEMPCLLLNLIISPTKQISCCAIIAQVMLLLGKQAN